MGRLKRRLGSTGQVYFNFSSGNEDNWGEPGEYYKLHVQKHYTIKIVHGW